MLSLENLTVNQFKALTGVHISENMTGKMECMCSLSTSCLENPHCIARAKDENTICSHCYAMRQFDYKENMPQCYEKNTKILTTELFPVNVMPLLNCMYFRFEAWGDLINTIQVENYFNLCLKNPGVKFALFTKNPWIIDDTLCQGREKPENLQIVYSSCFVNEQVNDAIIKKWSFIDKIFTVYDKINAKNVNINCGNKKCIQCRMCYEKNDIRYINEKLK